MTNLSMFSEDEADLLVSLPYRVGVWISYTDDEEGETDDEKEMKALENCITEVAKLHHDTPFIQGITKRTLSKQEKWPQWAENSFNVPADCQKAIALLKDRATERDIKNFRATLIEIATTVAQAYGEFGDFDDENNDANFFSNIVGKVVNSFSSLSHDDEGHPMNVSAAEDSALFELSEALKSS